MRGHSAQQAALGQKQGQGQGQGTEVVVEEEVEVAVVLKVAGEVKLVLVRECPFQQRAIRSLEAAARRKIQAKKGVKTST